MQPIKFYAEKRNLFEGARMFMAIAIISFPGMIYVPNNQIFSLCLFLSVVTAVGLGSIIRIWLTDAPVFTADAEGIKVLTHKKRPWSAIKKVSTVQLKLHWLIPAGHRFVSIKLQRGRTMTIPHAFLPGSAEDTAGAILQLKQQAELAQMGPIASSDLPVVAPEPRNRRAPVAPQDDGPIQSPRGLFSRKAL